MIIEISHFLSVLATGLFFLAGSFSLFTKNTLYVSNLISRTYSHGFLLLVTSFSIYIWLAISDNFSVQYIASHSNTELPTFYKISSIWSAHEGSMFLWIVFLSLWGFFFNISVKNDQILKSKSIGVISVILVGFLVFLLVTSNPFITILPIAPLNGADINPVLQDPALAIHPPILYLGYVGSSIIFSSALAATTLNYISKEWAQHIKQWVLMSWIFLTLGILLGSIWAYYELGWGGFWFWDPVENVSLMPWLALTTLLHCILALEKRLILTSWVIVLSISTFTLSMCGTFLVRSGILNSVHTFANDPERGIYILIFLFTLIFLSLFIFFFFHKTQNSNTKNFFWLSKETSILVNNWFMMYFLSVVLIGTVYPIFLEVITSDKISVGPPFYNKLIIPFLIPFLIAMAIGPKLKWIKSNLQNKMFLIFFLIISILLSIFIINSFNVNFLLNTILVASAFFLFFVSIKDLLNKGFKNYSQSMAHFGFSLFILSILFNNFLSTEIITNLKVGETFKSEKFKISFESIDQKSKKNFQAVIGKFIIENQNGVVDILNPELRIYNQPNIVTSEADIKTNLFTDKFMTMNVVQNQEYFNIRYQVKPFMIWIWFSVLLISFGGLLSFVRKRYES